MTVALTLTLMLCSVVIGTVLALAAVVLHAQERAANRPVRWIWTATIAFTVLLTVAVGVRGAPDAQKRAGIGSRVGDALLRPMPRIDEGPAAVLTRWTRAAIALPSAAVSATIASTGDLLSRVPASAQRGAALLWGGASLLSVAMLLVVYRRMRRSVDTWHIERLLGTCVRVSHDAGPAVVGLRPMEIVVPAWILTRPDHEQRLVLQHEQEHIRARDPLLLVGACVAVALMPWNPALWFGLSRLRLAVEIDCDRRVLRGGTTTHRYARLLLALSEHPSQLAGLLPALSYSASHLERRLLAMTARPARYQLPRRLAGGAVASVLILAACESRMPTSVEVENMDARKAVATAGALPGVDTARSRYTVDGVEVSKRTAEALEASEIASIEVVKGTDRSSQIRLRTISARPDTGTILPTRVRIADTTLAGAASTRMQVSKRSFDGIFIIDGKQVSDTVANAINPNRIESVEVVKGAAASTRYSDPRAINGVIVITTKNP